MKLKLITIAIISTFSINSVLAQSTTQNTPSTLNKVLTMITAIFSMTPKQAPVNTQLQNQPIYIQPQSSPPTIVQYNATPPTYLPSNANIPMSESSMTMPIYQSKNPTEMTDNYKPGTNTGYKWPVPESINGTKNGVVSPWGPRCGDIHPDGNQNCGSNEAGAMAMHNGVDINVPTGTAISSVNSGKVAWVDPYCNNQTGKAPPGGCAVSVINDKGEMFTYMHLSSVPSGLKSGAMVNEGQNIGASGNTGASEGAHLHLGACEVQPEKITGTENPTKYCRPENGGKAINPLDKLDNTDNRAINARQLEKLRNDYHVCLKAARAAGDTAKAAACKKAWQQKKAMPSTEKKVTPPDTRQSKIVF